MDVGCILMVSCTNEFYSDITYSGIHAFKMFDEIFFLRELRECIVNIKLISVEIASIAYKRRGAKCIKCGNKAITDI
ncbi:hypothetical protein D3C72_1975160 [compost metagenome]